MWYRLSFESTTYDRGSTDYISLDSLKKLNGLQFIQLNIRSLFHKIPVLRHDFVRTSMDIIGFTETWLNSQIPNSLLGIDSFNVYRNDRSYSRGGGVLVYTYGMVLAVLKIKHSLIGMWKYKVSH